MIYAITAPTGGGKTYMAMRMIEQWLVKRPDGHVVTNVALDIGELCDYLTKEYGDTLGAADRVRLLTLDEVGRFWLHYGLGYDLPGDRMEIRTGGSTRKELDYSCRDPKKGGAGHGVCYLIDEADEIFNAKDYADMCHDLRFYVRHQRKFTDDVYLMLPAWEWLVKEVRLSVHAVWVMENGAQMKLGKIPILGGMFRGVSWIKGTQWKTRQGGAWGGVNEIPKDTTRFKIDPQGLGRCYRTEEGLGVAGNGEMVRKGERAKGLSPAWMGVAALVFCVLLFLVPRAFGSMFAKGVTEVGGSKKITNAVAAVAPEKTAVEKAMERRLRGEKPLIASVEVQKAPERKTGRLTGIAMFNGRLRAFKEDGGVIYDGVAGVKFIRGPDGAYTMVWDGETLHSLSSSTQKPQT